MNEESCERRTAFAVQAQRLIGAMVTEAAVGVGSMITIEVEHSGEPHRIWIRLAEWALMKNEDEVVASDLPDADFERLKHRVGDLATTTILGHHLFDDGELHIAFSCHRRLEIWPNNEIYGEGSELVSLFAADGRVATLTG